MRSNGGHFGLFLLAISASLAPVRGQLCLTKGQCEGHILAEHVTEDITECYWYCRGTPTCHYYTFYPDIGLCTAMLTCDLNLDVCPTCQTGDVSCQPQLICLEPGFCHGQLVTATAAGTPQECLVECQAVQECAWFTWNSKESICILTQECFLDQDSCQDCVHGQRECPAGSTTTPANPGDHTTTGKPDYTTSHGPDNYCEANFTSPKGAFASPNYPEEYPDFVLCDWLIIVEIGKQVQLTFTDFETEYNSDLVAVFDGQSTSDPYLGVYSGHQGLIRTTSSGHVMHVRFKADQGVSRRGFRAEYKEVIGESDDE